MYILLDIIEYVMINSTSHQSWLFYSPLAKQAVLLKDDLLDPVDQLLEDPALVDLVQQCLAARSPASARTGRPGIPPDRVLRCCVMKHLKGWSFRDLERELRSNVVHHGRAVKYRLLEIARAAKSLTDASKQRMRDSYKKLVGLTRSVVRQASEVVERWRKGRLKVVGKFLRVEAQIDQLRHFLPLVEKVITQTKERVWGGNCHVEGKVLSLFEPHTEVIRKGKAHKPNEFGRLVRLDVVEHGIVSAYQVLTGNPADTTSWMPALQQHQACFGHTPQMATADRGFFSAKNEREAQVLGVKRVALPARGRLSAQRAKQQKQRWFRRALRWRAGCEATISTLKHPFSMLRASYKRDSGFQRYVGWCVITKNLFSIARYQERRRGHGQVG